jgi:polar amino acid transport system substrate-binding protein
MDGAHSVKLSYKITAGIIVIGPVVFVMIVWLFCLDKSLTRVQENGIRIGYAIEAPFAFLKTDGEVTGESPETAKRITALLGIRHIEWRQVEFDALISELEAGRIDIVAAGMFITPKRAQRISFSEPTFHVRQGLLVVKGNPWRLGSYQQTLSEPHIKIAVLSGSVEEELLCRMGMPEYRLVRVPDALTGRVAVESALAVGLALSSPAIKWMALRDQLGKTEIAQPFEQPELALKERLSYGAFAFRKEDRRLISAWNKELKAYIGSPYHQKLLAAFGFTQAELPGSITTKEVLAQ